MPALCTLKTRHKNLYGPRRKSRKQQNGGDIKAKIREIRCSRGSRHDGKPSETHGTNTYARHTTVQHDRHQRHKRRQDAYRLAATGYKRHAFTVIKRLARGTDRTSSVNKPISIRSPSSITAERTEPQNGIVLLRSPSPGGVIPSVHPP